MTLLNCEHKNTAPGAATVWCLDCGMPVAGAQAATSAEEKR